MAFARITPRHRPDLAGTPSRRMHRRISIHTPHVGIVHKAPSRFHLAREWRLIAPRFRDSFRDPNSAKKAKHNPRSWL
jgi:hypothetical protein